MTHTDKAAEPVPCGGCGAKSDRERCIGCGHDFGTPESEWFRDHPQDAESLREQVARLTDELGFSRAETAMAFEVASDAACRALNACLMDGMAMFVAERVAPAIMSSTPADATAALAARDKAKDDRIAEWRGEYETARTGLEIYRSKNTELVAERDELRAENARLREALAPFAKAGELFANIPASPDCYAVLYNPAAGLEYQITEHHVRAAWAALQSEVSHDRT